MIRHLPNLLTCCNLLCGCAGIVVASGGNLTIASVLIVAAAVFDFFDGFAARLLKAHSAIGKDLDSLADMTTFGVLPALMVFSMLQQTTGEYFVPYAAFALAVFSALRLAKFNNDPRQSDSFIGVPTPANALLIASVPWILRENPEYAGWILNTGTLLAFTGIMSWLMVAGLPLIAFKFKSFGWEGNEARYGLLLAALLLLLWLKIAAVPVIIVLYILVSLAVYLRAGKPVK